LFYQTMSNAFGASGFKIFKLGFAILFVSRLISIIVLSYANAGTLDLSSTMRFPLVAILGALAIYLFYSVKRYFGIDRAFGIDHFEPDRFKGEAFVRQGIFKYSSNAMYVFGFMVLWIPGLLLQSEAALLAAAFNHIYIWVHYFFTEKPDMGVIYGE